MIGEGFTYASDIAFTPTVKALQERRGSRATYARHEATGGWQTAVTPDLAAFAAQVRTLYVVTSNPMGYPYAQHRGGPKGFLKVLGPQTLGFADLGGNRQFITQGNLIDNPKAFLFLIDYARQQRVKIWGRARMIENDSALLARLFHEESKGRPERAFVFDILAWDVNCPRHIPPLLHPEDVAEAIHSRDIRIAELEEALRRATQNRNPDKIGLPDGSDLIRNVDV